MDFIDFDAVAEEVGSSSMVDLDAGIDWGWGGGVPLVGAGVVS